MEECNICFHDLDIETAWRCKKCKQICHQFCIETWYKNREVCPFCIQSISDTQLQYIDSDLGDGMLNQEVERKKLVNMPLVKLVLEIQNIYRLHFMIKLKYMTNDFHYICMLI